MSNLRIVGLLIGLLGLVITFFVYRGPRWKRFNFILYGLFSVFLVAVSVHPDVLNEIAGMLALEMPQRGRILALLIFSNISSWFIILYIKSRFDDYRHQFDLLIRSLGHESEKSILAKEISDKDIIVIIPAYNEADNLKILLPSIPSEILEKKVGVLVVDDGSDDDTASVVKAMGCQCVQNKINRGQGGASRLGYDVLKHYNIPIGVTMDADNQHSADDIAILVAPIIEDKYDLVIGSRSLGRAEGGSAMRGIGINVLSKIINLIANVRLTDCSSGFKAFNIQQMQKLELREEQFQSAEVLIQAAKKGLKIGEVPITVRERECGDTKKGKDLSYGINFIRTIAKAWWR